MIGDGSVDDPTIVRITHEAQYQQLGRLFEKVYGDDDAHLWRSFHGREPLFLREYSRVIAVDGDIVCHVAFVPRAMRIGSAVVRAGTIGYVATHADHQECGYASALTRF